ncbi:arylalkylamine N-acetyltransferase-like 2 [Chironomus tepperi]|uniref:arylalkylamine N-acetyltransferase-like 2 n=1 Tax=Chironomus tepperi TaxID=113505 RepID=UPI00391F3D19
MSKSIIYRLATVADSCEIQELFNTHYYPNEPITVGWINNDPVPEDLASTLEVLVEKFSIVAVDEATNRIVGACIAGVDTQNDMKNIIDEAKKTANKKWSQYLQLFARIRLESKIFEKFNVNESLHVHALVVDGNYQNNSIGYKLMEECFKLAASSDCKICSVNCSSIYTGKIATKLNMQCIGSIAMDSVIDEDGKRLIYPPEPHTHINSYAKRLSNDD